MPYIISSVYDTHREFTISDIYHSNNTILVKLEYYHITTTINIKDICFGRQCKINMYATNVPNPKHFINCGDSMITHWLGRELGDVYIETVNGQIKVDHFLNSGDIHVNNIFFKILGNHQPYKYPLLQIVWFDIRTHFVAITHIALLQDIQKIIQLSYLLLFNTTLQPSFKLFYTNNNS